MGFSLCRDPSNTLTARQLAAFHVLEQNNRDFTTVRLHDSTSPRASRYSRCLQEWEASAFHHFAAYLLPAVPANEKLCANSKQPVQTLFTTRSPRRSPPRTSTTRISPSRLSSKPVCTHLLHVARLPSTRHFPAAAQPCLLRTTHFRNQQR